MAAPYTLHGVWLSGPTYKVGLMLALTAQKFDYEFVNLREGGGQKPDYKAKSRWGQVPCLTVAATGKNLVQSAAILGYLAQATGKFAGAGPPIARRRRSIACVGQRAACGRSRRRRRRCTRARPRQS